MPPQNIFAELPASLPQELTETLLEAGDVRLERIVSHSHASPAGFWYDQDSDEWVIVLRGAAKLRFEESAEPVHLTAGDYVRIAAHRRHRVDWTSPSEPTIWLALFFQAE